jgi:AcrR family transcriptional regulator
MTQTLRAQKREANREKVKKIARAQMLTSGTQGLSLRGIAAEMDVTVTALYRYFPSLDDLITALIADGFDAHADAMQAAVDKHPGDPVRGLLAMMLAYRQWALDNTVDFQLLYGNPIPGYHAPTEVTVPKAWRGFYVSLQCLLPLFADGRLLPPHGVDLSVIAPTLAQFPDIPPMVLYIAVEGRLRMHGMVTLEIHGHMHGTVLNPDAFYRQECLALLRSMGINT